MHCIWDEVEGGLRGVMERLGRLACPADAMGIVDALLGSNEHARAFEELVRIADALGADREVWRALHRAQTLMGLTPSSTRHGHAARIVVRRLAQARG